MPTWHNKKVSRREFLKAAGITAGGATVAGVLSACSGGTTTILNTTTKTATTTATTTGITTVTSPVTTTVTTTTPVTTTVTAPPTTTSPASPRDTTNYVFFGPPAAATMIAIFDRLIPGDASDPGAVDAGAVIYTDRVLQQAGWGSAPISLRQAYFAANGMPFEYGMQSIYYAGLAAMDAYSQLQYGNIFSKLTGNQQDSVLTAMMNDTATGFTMTSASQFFNILFTHCKEGTFADPAYGGNVGGVGWKLTGFPGAYIAFSDNNMKVGADQSTLPIMTIEDELKLTLPAPENGY